jgi:ketosteroid isomerase-like protein
MPGDNIDIVRRFVDAFNRGDVEGVLELLDPAIEWRPALPLLLGEATVYRGHRGARKWLRDLHAVVDRAHLEYPRIRDLGNRVLAIGRLRIRGKGSGAETESPFAHLTDIKDGKAIRIWTYLDPQEAFEAAGLNRHRLVTRGTRPSRWVGSPSGALRR